MLSIIETAEHYEKLADQAEASAQWDRSHGFDLSLPGASPGDYKASAYRRTAQALRQESATGMPHCACHVLTYDKCPTAKG